MILTMTKYHENLLRGKEVVTASLPFYQEIWFIVLVCLIAVFLLCIFLATIFYKSSGTKAPYIRDRMPLALPPLRAPSSYLMREGDYSTDVVGDDRQHA